MLPAFLPLALPNILAGFGLAKRRLLAVLPGSADLVDRLTFPDERAHIFASVFLRDFTRGIQRFSRGVFFL